MKKFSVIFLLLVSITTMAQDKIVKKDGVTIDCIVSEVGLDEVKYHYTNKPNVAFSLDKALLAKIEFSTGEVMTFEGKAMNNPEYYVDQNKRALKLNFLSPLFGSTEIVYEQSIKPGRSWETALGIIGLGWDPFEYKAVGAYGKFAYKFMRSPNFYADRMRYDHILKGAYIAPEIAFRYTNYNAYNYYYTSDEIKRTEEVGIAVNLKFGKQWVFDDAFLIDTYVGFGYGYSSIDNEVLHYGFIASSGDVPISVTAGIRVGWTF